MIMRRLLATAAVAVGLLLVPVQPAMADLDCKESPAPDVPGQGLTGFYERAPDPLPPEQDPFAPGATTSIYQQYGYAGLRWHTYDLGCGPDMARQPDAVIGTAVSNWLLNLPIGFAGLTAAVTDVAFQPTFLGAFDPLIGNVSSTLYTRLFAQWVPVVLVLIGFLLLLRARRANLASSAAAIGWAALVLVIAATLFRWPVHAGHLADDTVTSSLGAVVAGLNRSDQDLDAGVAVSSAVHEQILYRNWLVGELGSADSATAREYGPQLFDAQALTWREAAILESDPEQGRRIIEAKREKFGEIADQIRDSDPAAYAHLTGARADTRVGFAVLTTLAIFLALPFLLVASLLLLGSFLIVRLAVMLFPALAILGLFPPARGVLVGTARVVGAALVNAIIFGVGAAVTITGIGVILNPESRLPGWLTVVLLPLFTFMMWFALKPFRRLTAMTSHADPFGEAVGAVGTTSRRVGRSAKRVGAMAAASFTGNVAAGAVVGAGDNDDEEEDQAVLERAEARPGPEPPQPPVASRPAAQPALVGAPAEQARQLPPASTDTAASDEPRQAGAVHREPVPPDQVARSEPAESGAPVVVASGVQPGPTESHPALPVTEADWSDGEEVYTIYRPDCDGGEDDDAA
jgi:hypothetical protein